MTEVRSSLAPFAPLFREPHAEHGWQAAHDAWHNHGIVLLNLAEVEKRRGWVAARQARNLAEECFGKRRMG